MTVDFAKKTGTSMDRHISATVDCLVLSLSVRRRSEESTVVSEPEHISLTFANSERRN